MRQSIHHHYNQLTKAEANYVDEFFREAYPFAKQLSIAIAGDDRMERAVDAFARMVIESRPALNAAQHVELQRKQAAPEISAADEDACNQKYAAQIMS